jgi:hypothetical protein
VRASDDRHIDARRRVARRGREVFGFGQRGQSAGQGRGMLARFPLGIDRLGHKAQRLDQLVARGVQHSLSRHRRGSLRHRLDLHGQRPRSAGGSCCRRLWLGRRRQRGGSNGRRRKQRPFGAQRQRVSADQRGSR